MEKDIEFPEVAEPKKRAYLAAYAACGILTHAARTAKIVPRTVYNWRADDPEFLKAEARAYQMAGDVLERHAWERATTGKRPSDLLLIFLIKGFRPEKYREQYNPNAGEITDEQLDARIADLARKKGISLFAHGEGAKGPAEASGGNGNGAASKTA